MRIKDVLILLAPVGLIVLALVAVPLMLLPTAHPLSPSVAIAAPTPGAAGSAASPVAAAPTGGAQGGSESTGGSGAAAATMVPTRSESGPPPTAGAATPAAAPAAPAAGTGNAQNGQQLVIAKGCGGCHTLEGVAGASGQVGPPLTHIGSVAATRKPGMDAAAYIRESIENPNAFLAPSFSAPSPMPPGLAQGAELDDLVAYLLTRQ